jgi:hypothetical protein
MRMRTAGTRAIVVLLATFLLAAQTLLPARAADSSLVVAALRVLEERYVDRVDPTTLLNAAIASLRKASNLGPDALADISAEINETFAVAAFTSAFKRAVQAAIPETQLGYTATRGMLASLRDSHTVYMEPARYQEQKSLRASQPDTPALVSISVRGKTMRDPPGSLFKMSTPILQRPRQYFSDSTRSPRSTENPYEMSRCKKPSGPSGARPGQQSRWWFSEASKG